MGRPYTVFDYMGAVAADAAVALGLPFCKHRSGGAREPRKESADAGGWLRRASQASGKEG
ncbi:hypothetical protein PF010_g18572 [Phytophthora fragariae]|uniref:Uncharacterized protein n=1 Tax=Phytophthora fragariae TaxID=53985 RepID=A0A6A3G672_9STRA|nr:hypothetical protein PF003_g24010 [Phytophthora fragariae]KAE8952443.1 hypothetical protein PF011_g32699 [Phytophthora fragariae]KAE9090474.1 hypothetical protein PF010_g18572 [Phytophthora fragariae]